MPEISILMPVFNAAPFLEACLHSILAQSRADWELLAVDDFSDDESLEILLRFEKMDPRVRVLRNEQKGIAPALRTACKHSSGRFITRMDADDLMLPQKLERLAALLLAHGPGHVATGAVRYFAEGKKLEAGYERYARWLNDLAATGQHFKEVYRECVIPSPCWMAWRKDLLRIGAFQHDTYPEDYDLCFRMYHGGLRVLSTAQPLHRWRDHPARTSRTSEVYRDNRFLELKWHWFFKTDYRPGRPMVLWGAGKKGKQIARRIQAQSIPFRWVCNTPSKWGHQMFGVPFEPTEVVQTLAAPVIIVAVGKPGDQQQIIDYLRRMDWQEGREFFRFA